MSSDPTSLNVAQLNISVVDRGCNTHVPLIYRMSMPPNSLFWKCLCKFAFNFISLTLPRVVQIIFSTTMRSFGSITINFQTHVTLFWSILSSIINHICRCSTKTIVTMPNNLLICVITISYFQIYGFLFLLVKPHNLCQNMVIHT